jgi:hypothetical protein
MGWRPGGTEVTSPRRQERPRWRSSRRKKPSQCELTAVGEQEGDLLEHLGGALFVETAEPFAHRDHVVASAEGLRPIDVPEVRAKEPTFDAPSPVDAGREREGERVRIDEVDLTLGLEKRERAAEVASAAEEIEHAPRARSTLGDRAGHRPDAAHVLRATLPVAERGEHEIGIVVVEEVVDAE